MTGTVQKKRPLRPALVGAALGEAMIIVIAGIAGAFVYSHFGSRPVVDSALGCVNTVVTQAEAPSGPSMAQGGDMQFRDDIAPGHGTRNAQILGVYIAPNSYPVAAAGDKVRVCLLSVPQKDKAPGSFIGCDPAVDIRGRTFVVYDFANGQAEVYQNGEHACGGA